MRKCDACIRGTSTWWLAMWKQMWGIWWFKMQNRIDKWGDSLSYHRASQKQAQKGTVGQKRGLPKKTKKKKGKEKELPNTPFNFGVMHISLLLVLPHMPWKNILVMVQQFIHSHTHIHAYIHTYKPRPCPITTTTQKGIHSSFLFNRAHTNKHNKRLCCLTTTTTPTTQ
jgi:hypothetical protein